MLKNIYSLGKTLNKEQRQSINGGSPTPWDHPQNKECVEHDDHTGTWNYCDDCPWCFDTEED